MLCIHPLTHLPIKSPPSKLNESFLATAAKYREIINNAVQADKVVQTKFETNRQGMEILSKEQREMEQAVQAMGCGQSGGAVGNSAAVQKLRQLMEQVETMKVERDVIESELKSATFSMKDQFMAALAQDGAINEPAISVPEIGKRLQPLQAQVQDSVRRQEEMVKEIQAANAQFTAEKGGSATSSRETLLSQLATAFDIFMELQSNLKEGTKFYSDLTQLLIVFQNKISDFCFARKTEKEELMKDLTQQTSRAAAGPAATPQVPTHHTNFAPTNPHQTPATPAANPSIPYPQQMNTMPQPYGATPLAPYPTYVPPPMPQGFNPYATLPYPQRELRKWRNNIWILFLDFVSNFCLIFYSRGVQLPGIPTGTAAQLLRHVSRGICATATAAAAAAAVSAGTARKSASSGMVRGG